MDKRLKKGLKKKGLKGLAHNEDIVYMIFNKCSLRDCCRMGAVCKSWLSVFKWSTKNRLRPLPWLMMLSNPNFKSAEKEVEEDQDRCFFSLSENTMSDAIKFPELRGKRCCGSFNNGDARGWLMIIDDENLEMLLFHPWRRIQLQLPHHSALPRQYPPLNTQEFPTLVDTKIKKSAMSDDATVVAVIHDLSALAFCRIDDRVWTSVSVTAEFVGYGFSDVIYHKGQFYAITNEGSIGIIHINTPNPYLQILTGLDIIPFIRTYLVADSASMSLFIIVRVSLRPDEVEDQYDEPPYEVPDDAYNLLYTLGFKVYEVGWEETGEYKKNPVEVESLGDRVIFLGQNSSMLVMASQFPGLKGNRIYFTDDYMEAYLFESPIGRIDLGIFNMEDKTIQLLFRDRFHPNFSPPVWIAPPKG